MSTVEQVTAAVTDHLERRWLVWAAGIVALIVGIVIGYVLPSGAPALDATSSILGGGTSQQPIQGGR